MNYAAKYTTLDQTANLRAGYPFRGQIQEAMGSGIGVVQLKNCNVHSGIDWAEVTETNIPEKSKTPWLENGDIVFAARGGKYYALTVRPPEQHKFGKGLLAAPHFYILRVHNGVIPEFLAWQLNALPCQQYFESTAVGSVVKSMRRDALAKTPLHIPSTDQQAQILKVVDAVHQERQIAEALKLSGEQLLNGIAQNLKANASRDGSGKLELTGHGKSST